MNMKKFFLLSLAVVLSFSGIIAQAQSLSPSTKWHWDKGTIVIDTPQRPAGQQHVLGLAAAPIQTVRVAFVGLGMRGDGAVNRFAHIPGVEIVALVTTKKHVLKNANSISASKVLLLLLFTQANLVTKKSASVQT